MGPHLASILLSTSTGVVVTRQIAFALIALLLLAAIAKCIWIAHRPKANVKSAVAMILVLGALFVCDIAGLIVQMTSAQTSSVIAVVTSLLVIGIILTAEIFALVGIVQTSTSPHGKYDSGFKLALYAFCLSILIYNVSGTIVMTGLVSANRENSVLASTDTAGNARLSPVMNSRPIELVTENLWFNPPPSPWVRADPKALAPTACLSFIRANPNVYFMAIVEPIGADSPITVEQAADFTVASVQSAATDIRWTDRSYADLAGIHGIAMMNQVTVGAQRFSSVHWIGIAQGRAYHFTAWGNVRDEQFVRQQASMLFAGFRPLSSNNVAQSINAVTEYSSQRYRYTVKLPGGGWQKWAGIKSIAPDAEFGTMNGSDTGLYTSAIAIEDAKVDFELLLQSVAKVLKFETRDVQRIRSGGQDAAYVHFAIQGEKAQYDHLVEVAHIDDMLFIAHGWTSNPQKKQRLLDAISNIAFQIPAKVSSSAMSPDESHLDALIFNELGITYLGRLRQPDTAVKFFQRAVDLAPTEVRIVDNLAEAQLEVGQPRLARQVITGAIERFPYEPVLRIRAAMICEELGDVAAASSYYADVFKNGYQDDQAMRQYVMLMVHQNAIDPAIAAVEQYRKRFNSRGVAMLHAMLLGKKGKHDDAVALLTELRKGVEFDPDLTFMLGEQYAYQQRYSDTLDMANEMFKRGVTSADAYLLRAEAENGMKQYRQAKATLETALHLSPNDRECQDLMRVVQSMLGEGDSSLASQPIDAVPIPPELLADIPADAPADAEGAGAYYIARITAMSFEAGKEQKTTDFRRIKTLTRHGVETFSTMEFGFDPVFEGIYVNQLEVKDASGKVVYTGKAQDYFVSDAPAEEQATLKKILHIPISGLAPDCTIELTITRREFSPPKTMPFIKHFLSGALPVLRAGFALKTSDWKAIAEKASDGVIQIGSGGTVCWKTDKPRMFSFEPMQADPSTYMPCLSLGDAGASWKMLGDEYLDTVKDVLAADETCKPLVAEITRGAANDEARLAAIVGYVQREYAYKAIEFGRRGRIPEKASKIIQNKYGDCKDHSLLLYQLLQAAGFEPRLVLASTNDAIEPRIASMDQFNHMIAAVRVGEALRFFDCTNKACKIESPASSVAGEKVLVLQKGSSELVDVPELPSDSCLFQVNRQMSIETGGDLEVHDIVHMTGGAAAIWRTYLENATSDDERSKIIRGTISDAGVDVQIKSVSVDQLHDAPQPLAIDVTYVIRARFGRVQQQLVGVIPACWERYWLMPQETTKRFSPFRLRLPTLFQCDSTLQLPAGAVLAAVPTDAKLQSQFGSLQTSFKNSGQALSWNTTIRTDNGRFDAPAWAEFFQSRQKMIVPLEPALTVQVK